MEHFKYDWWDGTSSKGITKWHLTEFDKMALG